MHLALEMCMLSLCMLYTHEIDTDANRIIISIGLDFKTKTLATIQLTMQLITSYGVKCTL